MPNKRIWVAGGKLAAFERVPNELRRASERALEVANSFEFNRRIPKRRSFDSEFDRYFDRQI